MTCKEKLYTGTPDYFISEITRTLKSKTRGMSVAVSNLIQSNSFNTHSEGAIDKCPY